MPRKKDSGCMETSTAGLLEVYAWQLLTLNPDLLADELIEAEQMYLSDVKSQRLKLSLDC